MTTPPTAEERAQKIVDGLCRALGLPPGPIKSVNESIIQAIRDAETEAVGPWREWLYQAGPLLESYYETGDYLTNAEGETLARLLEFWRAHASHISRVERN